MKKTETIKLYKDNEFVVVEPGSEAEKLWLKNGFGLEAAPVEPLPDDFDEQVDATETIEELRALAEGFGFSVHQRATDLDKAKAKLTGQTE
ncbi:MAG: hypothetical protein DRJ65_00070 [Acidobacteria bacterium]|nr:MAG: hypothetical protein DRJ65_00070 [Acidobacteriota bacterium]